MNQQDVIWSKSIRLIHWLVALPIFLNLILFDDGKGPHPWLGYLAFVSVIVRMIFGIKGSGHALFKHFPLRPSQLISFLTHPLSKNDQEYQGHNPAASIVYICLWTCVIGLGITGWMMGLDAFWGDETLEDVHKGFVNVVKLLIVLHFGGILFDSMKFKRRTWQGMIFGNRG